MENEKIKILIAINDLLVGGAQRLVVDQLAVFDRDLYDLHLITFMEFDGRADFYEKIPSHIKLTKFNFKGFLDFKSHKKLFRYLAENKVHCIVSHLFFSNTILRLYKPFFRYKIITVEHNVYIFKKNFHKIIDILLARLSDSVVAVSKSVFNYVSRVQLIKHPKLRLIHNGIDLRQIQDYILTAKDREQMRKELGLASQDIVFVNVGRLTYQKNQQLLISSFLEYIRLNSSAKLLILGEGAMKECLVRLIGSAGGDRIQILGNKDNIFDYLYVGDYFINTSYIEGLSMGMLESMAFGLPVISTRTAGTDEVLEDGVNGFFIADMKKETVLKTLCKTELHDLDVLRKEAKQTVRNYDLINNVEKYSVLIKEII